MRPGALAAACAHRMQVPAARNALRGGLGFANVSRADLFSPPEALLNRCSHL